MNYGIEKINSKEVKKVISKPYDLYAYEVFTGEQKVTVATGDSAWVVTENKTEVIRGGCTIDLKSNCMCVVIRGYCPDSKSVGYESKSNLPYVNGCSSNQLISPLRVGDPTAQLLLLPPHTHEQEHHIHSTVRVVYVLSGKGKSIQGMKGHTTEVELLQGDVLILDKMTPHHFSTEEEELIVIPIHIFSSTQLEYNHPMFNGTFKV